jgi:hypothetical protein
MAATNNGLILTTDGGRSIMADHEFNILNQGSKFGSFLSCSDGYVWGVVGLWRLLCTILAINENQSSKGWLVSYGLFCGYELFREPAQLILCSRRNNNAYLHYYSSKTTMITMFCLSSSGYLFSLRLYNPTLRAGIRSTFNVREESQNVNINRAYIQYVQLPSHWRALLPRV